MHMGPKGKTRLTRACPDPLPGVQGLLHLPVQPSSLLLYTRSIQKLVLYLMGQKGDGRLLCIYPPSAVYPLSAIHDTFYTLLSPRETGGKDDGLIQEPGLDQSRTRQA